MPPRVHGRGGALRDGLELPEDARAVGLDLLAAGSCGERANFRGLVVGCIDANFASEY